MASDPRVGLPEGWDAQFDRASGRWYYRNHVLRTTTWERPVAQPRRVVTFAQPAAAAPSAAAPVAAASAAPAAVRVDAPLSEPLPPGWSAARDPKSGRVYYSNHVTKSTTWDKPTTSAYGPSQQTLEPLPKGWMMVPEQGGNVYVNVSTGQRQRTRPRPERVVSNVELYRSVVRAVLVDGQLLEAELALLADMRAKHGITMEEHEAVMQEMGLDDSKVNELRSKSKTETGAPERECVICLESGVSHVVLPCMHYCLCKNCAEMLRSLEPSRRNCPMCRGRVQETKQVF